MTALDEFLSARSLLRNSSNYLIFSAFLLRSSILETDPPLDEPDDEDEPEDESLTENDPLEEDEEDTLRWRFFKEDFYSSLCFLG